MPFFQSLAARLGVKSILENVELDPEASACIGLVTALVTADLHGHLTAHKEGLEAIDSALKTHETSYEVENLTAIDSDVLVNEMENIIASVEKGYEYTLDNLDSNKTEEVFSQIDLAQARINKDQEEIQFLAEETDELLNQLEYKAI